MNLIKRDLVRLKWLPALATVVFSIAVCVLLCNHASSQTLSRQSKKLSASEIALVQSSRSAILSTGISARYFDKHFRLIRVVEKVGDRRVMWNYSIGGYQTVLNDAVGFYTNEKGQKVNIHSVRNTLSSAHDITKTIPKKRAEKLMLQCIGKYTLGTVVFQSFGTTRRASLLFTASSIAKPPEEKRKDERSESEKNRREEEDRPPSEGKSPMDAVEDEGDEEKNDRPTVFVGFVDLETGTCTKGIAQAGHPVPIEE